MSCSAGLGSEKAMETRPGGGLLQLSGPSMWNVSQHPRSLDSYSTSGSSSPVHPSVRNRFAGCAVRIRILVWVSFEHTLSTVQQSLLISATLGVTRDDVSTFYKSPYRPNVYQQIRHVKEISTRWILKQIFCSWKSVSVGHLLIHEFQGIVTNHWVSSWPWLPQGGRFRFAKFIWLFLLLFWMIRMQWTLFFQVFCSSMDTMDKACKCKFSQISWPSLFLGGGGPNEVQTN